MKFKILRPKPHSPLQPQIIAFGRYEPPQGQASHIQAELVGSMGTWVPGVTITKNVKAPFWRVFFNVAANNPKLGETFTLNVRSDGALLGSEKLGGLKEIKIRGITFTEPSSQQQCADCFCPYGNFTAPADTGVTSATLTRGGAMVTNGLDNDPFVDNTPGVNFWCATFYDVAESTANTPDTTLTVQGDGGTPPPMAPPAPTAFGSLLDIEKGFC
jgi:hypothetical protein